MSLTKLLFILFDFFFKILIYFLAPDCFIVEEHYCTSSEPRKRIKKRS